MEKKVHDKKLSYQQNIRRNIPHFCKNTRNNLQLEKLVDKEIDQLKVYLDNAADNHREPKVIDISREREKKTQMKAPISSLHDVYVLTNMEHNKGMRSSLFIKK